jgi:N-acetylmuramoyl-L-alanine amidase
MYIQYHPSPNHEERRGVISPSLVIFHYTGMQEGKVALARLCDPASKVSAHYLIEEDGRIFHMVDEEQRAWHAGASFWRGIRDVNSHSIGIEIVNPGHEWGYQLFPEVQMRALLTLCRDIRKRYSLPPAAFIGHSDVAPLRKQDPGELFDWPMLAREGFGLWPEVEEQDKTSLTLAEAQQKLLGIGYDCPQTGKMDETTKKVIEAFQRHFRPAEISGALDDETGERLNALSRLCGGSPPPAV